MSSSKKHVVKVRIVGEEYSIRSEAAPERVRQVADHVDHIIREVMAGSAVVETHRAAILAALQITEELFRARDDARALDRSMSALSGELRRLLPPAKRETGTQQAVDS